MSETPEAEAANARILLARAIAIAADAHRDQPDLLGEAYILHPLIVMQCMRTTDERIVAVLHDTVEDQPDRVSLQRLRDEGFPPHIVRAVDAISRRRTDGRKEPEDAYLERVRNNALALRVKLMDVAHNASPARNGRLDPERRERFRLKYNYALAFLTEDTWTGPLPEDMGAEGHLLQPVPPERWPYGRPRFHEACCLLHEGGLWCDCKASDASDREWGEGA